MGVRGVDNIVAMTEVLGKLGVTSDVVGQEGATMIGRILSLTGEGAAGVKQFGDALNQLGNNSKASESEILQMASAVAQSTSEFGLSSKQVLALSAAARELDLRFEVTGSAFGRVLRNLQDGSASGAKSFKTFLAQANMMNEQFREMLQNDPSQILISFAEAYAKMTKTGQAVPFLEDFKLNTDEIKRVFGTIGVRVNEVRQTMNQVGGTEWVGALDREFEAFANAQENRIIAMGKAMVSAFATVGEALAPLTGPISLCCPARVQPDTGEGEMSTIVSTPLTPAVRTRLEQAIESLIALLDEMESDSDLEPVLGWPEQGIEALQPDLLSDNREEENEHGGNVEDEPQMDEAEYDGPGFIPGGQGL